jgi:hypothetical protein
MDLTLVWRFELYTGLGTINKIASDINDITGATTQMSEHDAISDHSEEFVL